MNVLSNKTVQNYFCFLPCYSYLQTGLDELPNRQVSHTGAAEGRVAGSVENPIFACPLQWGAHRPERLDHMYINREIFLRNQQGNK